MFCLSLILNLFWVSLDNSWNYSLKRSIDQCNLVFETWPLLLKTILEGDQRGNGQMFVNTRLSDGLKRWRINGYVSHISVKFSGVGVRCGWGPSPHRVFREGASPPPLTSPWFIHPLRSTWNIAKRFHLNVHPVSARKLWRRQAVLFGKKPPHNIARMLQMENTKLDSLAYLAIAYRVLFPFAAITW